MFIERENIGQLLEAFWPHAIIDINCYHKFSPFPLSFKNALHFILFYFWCCFLAGIGVTFLFINKHGWNIFFFMYKAFGDFECIKVNNSTSVCSICFWFDSNKWYFVCNSIDTTDYLYFMCRIWALENGQLTNIVLSVFRKKFCKMIFFSVSIRKRRRAWAGHRNLF